MVEEISNSVSSRYCLVVSVAVCRLVGRWRRRFVIVDLNGRLQSAVLLLVGRSSLVAVFRGLFMEAGSFLFVRYNELCSSIVHDRHPIYLILCTLLIF